MSLMENAKFAKGLDPIADGFAGANVRPDIYNMENYNEVTFVIFKGVGTTGTSTIIVNSCTSAAGANRTAIAFRYKAITSGDTEGATTAATSSGFATTAGSSQLYLVSVLASDLEDGHSFVELEMDELVNDPVLGGTIAIFTGARYAKDSGKPTSLV